MWGKQHVQRPWGGNELGGVEDHSKADRAGLLVSKRGWRWGASMARSFSGYSGELREHSRWGKTC